MDTRLRAALAVAEASVAPGEAEVRASARPVPQWPDVTGDEPSIGNLDAAPSTLRTLATLEDAPWEGDLDSLEAVAGDLLRGRFEAVHDEVEDSPTSIIADEFTVAMAFAEDTLAYRPDRIDALLPPRATSTNAPSVVLDEEAAPSLPFGAGAFPIGAITPPPAPDQATHSLARSISPSKGALADRPTPRALIGVSFARYLESCDASHWGAPSRIPSTKPLFLQRTYAMGIDIKRVIEAPLSRQQARAFARSARWGALHTSAETEAFLFMAEALNDATAASTGFFETDLSLSVWGLRDADASHVVTGKAPQPMQEPGGSVEDVFVIDDLCEDQVWHDTFWEEVDRYLTETDAPRQTTPDRGATAEEEELVLDFYLRDAPRTHFWSPGDAPVNSIEGQGRDLFVIGAEDAASVVLIEDGASHAMRTGVESAVNAVVVSYSRDSWTDVESMRWKKVATLTGVEHIRIEQNIVGSRHAVLAGDFCATDLEDEEVQLVRMADTGDIFFPVVHLSGTAFVCDDTFQTALQSRSFPGGATFAFEA